MGEISDALRRAREQREADRATTARHVDPAAEPHRVALEAVREASLEISREKRDLWVPRAVLVEAEGPVAERFRHLAIRVRSELEGRRPPILLVTSAGRGEGKTTTACNLALALASISGGQRIALVDLDLRRPSLARALGIRFPERPEDEAGKEAGPGIEGVLRGAGSLHSACVETELPTLDVYPVRKPYRAAHSLLSGPGPVALFRDLARRYDTVICDTPPVLPVPDVALLIEHAGACLAVVRAGQTRRSAFRAMARTLPPEKLIGTFLNEERMARSTYRYYEYYGDDEQ